MIRRIFILLTLLVLAVYVVIAMTVLNGKPDNEVCKNIELSVKDSVNYGFVTFSEVKRMLQQEKLYPVGKKRADINVRQMEDALNHHPFINNAECYLTSGNNVAIHLYQRVPVMHIMSNNGDDYYIDHMGKVMSVFGKPVHVAVATGDIDRNFAKKELYALGKYLQTDRFWDSQIEQIHVTEKKEIELVPRVGNQILFLGKPEDYTEKFRKLRAFYQNALNKVGWNKYDYINVEFGNQIICTKK